MTARNQERRYKNTVAPSSTILMVVDGSVGYDERDFGLSDVIRVLLDESLIPPKLYCAYRGTKESYDNGAVGDSPVDVEMDFTFTPEALNDIDQIWLFGIGNASGVGANSDPSDTSAVNELELEVLSRFMDSGGGVFATGDHEDFGLDLCGRIPRVRSMRKWWYWEGDNKPEDVPSLQTKAPSANGEDRRDTVQKSIRSQEGIFIFEDQSDDIPQPVYAVQHPSAWSVNRSGNITHPVIASNASAIHSFPDHAHEGECCLPQDLTATYSFGQYRNHDEYPLGVMQNKRIVPEIIAWGRVQPHHQTLNNGYDDCTNESCAGKTIPTTLMDSFGLVGVYDGHEAGVGRVVVDSTWHHWFNINLVGDPSGIDEQHDGLKGNEQAYSEVKQYYLNISRWLNSEEKQDQNQLHTLFDLSKGAPLDEFLTIRKVEDVSVERLKMIGAVALSEWARVTSQTDANLLAMSLLSQLETAEILNWNILKNWSSISTKGDDIDLPSPICSNVLQLAVGGAIQAIHCIYSSQYTVSDMPKLRDIALHGTRETLSKFAHQSRPLSIKFSTMCDALSIT